MCFSCVHISMKSYIFQLLLSTPALTAADCLPAACEVMTILFRQKLQEKLMVFQEV